MKEKSSEIKKNLATGASSAIGSTIGVMAGAAIASPEASAEELPQETIQQEDLIEAVAVQDEVEVIAEVENSDNEGEAFDSYVEVEAVADDEPEVELIGYHTIEFEDGTVGSAAALSVNGTESVLVDTTGDGKANIAMIDLNHDGEISDDEVFDANDADIDMSQFAGMPTQGELYAANDMPDYVNDADAGTYMA